MVVTLLRGSLFTHNSHYTVAVDGLFHRFLILFYIIIGRLR